MKLYLAGIYALGFHFRSRLYDRLTENEKFHRRSVQNSLESYHYVHKEKYVEMMRKDGVQIFLDSGAFSAYTKGVEIDLPGYCDYIIRNNDILEKVDGITVASVLDAVGDPLKTWQNQQEMERLGAKPLPCFHYGEDERYLEWYVANYNYITLGGMVPISTPQLRLWLDRLWDKYLVDGSGRPKVRVHGFGLTTVSLMERYPWFSVDSSSWVQTAGVGGMMILPEAKIVNVSKDNPAKKVENQHLDSMPDIMRDELVRRLAACGVDTDRMREEYLTRWVYNIWAYTELGKAHFRDDPIFELDQQGLF